MKADAPDPRVERLPATIWRFAHCEFDAGRRALRVHGAIAEIEAKPLAVLHQLLLHAGEVLTKEELLDAAWPGLTVVDNSLATAISKLRRAIGDDGVIVTVSRVGYRLGVAARAIAVEPPDEWPQLALHAGDPVPGRAHWKLTRRLDLSLSSEVWLAHHPKTGEVRVFKFAADAARLKGLKREVTLARLLRGELGECPAFVRLLEWNFETTPYWIESEYSGPSLVEWAAREGGLGAIPRPARLALVADVAEAIGAAHAVDVLHKDLKPANILIASRPDGTPQIKIADFGSAALLTPARLSALGITNLGFTQTGESSAGDLTGTALYVAPEVVAGESPSPRSDVYALGVLLYQMVIGDLRQPLAPGWEARVDDPLLREDIAAAADGNPARRFPAAGDLASRLRSLADRRACREEQQRLEAHQRAAEERRAAARRHGSWWLTATAVMAACTAAVWIYVRAQAAAPVIYSPQTIAVMPLENSQGDPALDYLRVALSDEVVAVLNRAPALSLRPLSGAGHTDTSPAGLRDAGRRLEAGTVVTGHFARTGDRLHVTLEATDTAHGRLVWRDQMETPAASLIATEMQIALRVRNGLAPALGAPQLEEGPTPTNEAAYALYLQSVAIPLDPGPNPKAIAMLEQSTALDPDYAPAWIALGRRYYIAGRYANEDQAMYERGLDANRRAAALDPDYAAAAVVLSGVQIEAGDLSRAYLRLRDLLKRWPQSADAHFTLSYALRYAGVLDEAARECETALFLEARTQNSGLRSCVVVFILSGDYTRALNYLELARGTEFAKAMTMHMLVRQRQEAAAIQLGAPDIPRWTSYPLLLACATHKPAADIDALAARVGVDADPETNYFAAAHLAYCGRSEQALDLLGRAVDGHYCGYPAMESDPMFDRLRESSAFTAVRNKGKACRDRFLEEIRARPS